MYAWLIVLHLVATPAARDATDDATAAAEPLRYRGIERLLAKFEAAADAEVQKR